MAETSRRNVEIRRGFWLSKYVITQGQWESVMGQAAWADANHITPWAGRDYVEIGSDHPAVCISWYNVQAFIRELNWAGGSAVYRLPSEAAWEHACRAGTQTLWSFGSNKSNLTHYAWYAGNARNVDENYAHAVGRKHPNPWGLYDMHGNVWEWVQDLWGEAYSEKLSENPPWIAWSCTRAKGPSFPRKRESSGQRRHTRADIRSFQTASDSSLRVDPKGLTLVATVMSSGAATSTMSLSMRDRRIAAATRLPIASLGSVRAFSGVVSLPLAGVKGRPCCSVRVRPEPNFLDLTS